MALGGLFPWGKNASPLALVLTQLSREGLVPFAQGKRTELDFFFLMHFQAQRENCFSRGEKGDY